MSILREKLARVVKLHQKLQIPLEEMKTIFADGWKGFTEITCQVFSPDSFEAKKKVSGGEPPEDEADLPAAGKECFLKGFHKIGEVMINNLATLSELVTVLTEIEEFSNANPTALPASKKKSVSMYLTLYKDMQAPIKNMLGLKDDEEQRKGKNVWQHLPFGGCGGVVVSDDDDDMDCSITNKDEQTCSECEECSECGSECDSGTDL